MKRGRDAQTGQMMTIQQYIDKYGTKLDQYGAIRIRPQLRCPMCAFTLHPVGENNAGLTDAFFAHDVEKKGTQKLFCILKINGSFKYSGLTPTHPDIQGGIVLRNSFMENWRKHWTLIRTYVKYPDINAFIRAIQHLDKSKTWQHKNLREELVPYIVLSLLEFAPPTGKAAGARALTYRFWFDGSVRTIEDLWIRTTGEFQLIRAEYLPVVPPARTLKEVIDCHDVTADLDFLNRPLTNTLHPVQVNAMAKAFRTV